MKIFLQFTDNEAKHLKLLESNQTFFTVSEKMEFKAWNRDGAIVIQVHREFGSGNSGSAAPIFVQIPQNAITANTPLWCSKIENDF